METATKVCRKCGATKPLDQFYRHTISKDGLRGYCKVCSKAASVAHSRANLPKLAAKAALWRAENPQRARERATRVKEACTDAYLSLILKMPVSQVPPELLELKREQLKHKRALKELKEFLTEEGKSK